MKKLRIPLFFLSEVGDSLCLEQAPCVTLSHDDIWEVLKLPVNTLGNWEETHLYSEMKMGSVFKFLIV